MADSATISPYNSTTYVGEAVKVNFYVNGDTTKPVQSVYGSYYRVESSDTSIATVDKDGYIVGVGAGRTQIKVYLGNNSSSYGYGYVTVSASREPNNTRYLNKTGLQDLYNGIMQKVDDKILESNTYRTTEQKTGEWINR